MFVAINYHYVRPSFEAPHPGIHGITPKQLEAQLCLLGRLGDFVSADQVAAAVRGERPLPEKAMLVTFDDGLKEQYIYAWPILQRLGIPALFFINTAPIANQSISTVHKIHLLRAHISPPGFEHLVYQVAQDNGLVIDPSRTASAAIAHYKYDTPTVARLKYVLNFVLNPSEVKIIIDAGFAAHFSDAEPEMSRHLYMSVDEVRALSAMGGVGSHAHEHVPLGLLEPEKSKDQLEKAALLLNEWTGQRPNALSYPYGSKEASSREVGQAAEVTGITYAFTMERAGNPDMATPLFLARFDNNDVPGGKAARWAPEVFFEEMPHRQWYLTARIGGSFA